MTLLVLSHFTCTSGLTCFALSQTRIWKWIPSLLLAVIPIKKKSYLSYFIIHKDFSNFSKYFSDLFYFSNLSVIVIT